MGYAGCGFDHCKTAKTKVGQFFGNLALTLKFLDYRSQLTSILRMRVVLSGQLFPGNSSLHMADQDLKLVGDFPLKPMGAEGFPCPPV